MVMDKVIIDTETNDAMKLFASSSESEQMRFLNGVYIKPNVIRVLRGYPPGTIHCNQSEQNRTRMNPRLYFTQLADIKRNNFVAIEGHSHVMTEKMRNLPDFYLGMLGILRPSQSDLNVAENRESIAKSQKMKMLNAIFTERHHIFYKYYPKHGATLPLELEVDKNIIPDDELLKSIGHKKRKPQIFGGFGDKLGDLFGIKREADICNKDDLSYIIAAVEKSAARCV